MDEIGMHPKLQFVRLNNFNIAFRMTGPAQGVPVVLSHSLFFDHRMFDPLAALLAELGYCVVAYDHRGQGQSSRAPRTELTMDALTADAAALIQHLGLGPVHFGGNSLGGFVALRLAARHPELVRSVAAIGSSAEQEYAIEAFAPLVEAMSIHGATPVTDAIMHIMFGDTTLGRGGALTTSWRDHIAQLDATIGDCAYQVIHRERIAEELKNCRVPVIAIAGDEDHAYPPPISSENIADASGGVSVIVQGAGHSVSLEKPTEVASHLVAHFQRSD